MATTVYVTVPCETPEFVSCCENCAPFAFAAPVIPCEAAAEVAYVNPAVLEEIDIWAEAPEQRLLSTAVTVMPFCGLTVMVCVAATPGHTVPPAVEAIAVKVAVKFPCVLLVNVKAGIWVEPDRVFTP